MINTQCSSYVLAGSEYLEQSARRARWLLPQAEGTLLSHSVPSQVYSARLDKRGWGSFKCWSTTCSVFFDCFIRSLCASPDVPVLTMAAQDIAQDGLLVSMLATPSSSVPKQARLFGPGHSTVPFRASHCGLCFHHDWHHQR